MSGKRSSASAATTTSSNENAPEQRYPRRVAAATAAATAAAQQDNSLLLTQTQPINPRQQRALRTTTRTTSSSPAPAPGLRRNPKRDSSATAGTADPDGDDSEVEGSGGNDGDTEEEGPPTRRQTRSSSAGGKTARSTTTTTTSTSTPTLTTSKTKAETKGSGSKRVESLLSTSAKRPKTRDAEEEERNPPPVLEKITRTRSALSNILLGKRSNDDAEIPERSTVITKVVAEAARRNGKKNTKTKTKASVSAANLAKAESDSEGNKEEDETEVENKEEFQSSSSDDTDSDNAAVPKVPRKTANDGKWRGILSLPGMPHDTHTEIRLVETYRYHLKQAMRKHVPNIPYRQRKEFEPREDEAIMFCMADIRRAEAEIARLHTPEEKMAVKCEYLDRSGNEPRYLWGAMQKIHWDIFSKHMRTKADIRDRFRTITESRAKNSQAFVRRGSGYHDEYASKSALGASGRTPTHGDFVYYTAQQQRLTDPRDPRLSLQNIPGDFSQVPKYTITPPVVGKVDGEKLRSLIGSIMKAKAEHERNVAERGPNYILPFKLHTTSSSPNAATAMQGRSGPKARGFQVSNRIRGAEDVVNKGGTFIPTNLRDNRNIARATLASTLMTVGAGSSSGSGSGGGGFRGGIIGSSGGGGGGFRSGIIGSGSGGIRSGSASASSSTTRGRDGDVRQSPSSNVPGLSFSSLFSVELVDATNPKIRTPILTASSFTSARRFFKENIPTIFPETIGEDGKIRIIEEVVIRYDSHQQAMNFFPTDRIIRQWLLQRNIEVTTGIGDMLADFWTSQMTPIVFLLDVIYADDASRANTMYFEHMERDAEKYIELFPRDRSLLLDGGVAAEQEEEEEEEEEEC